MNVVPDLYVGSKNQTLVLKLSDLVSHRVNSPVLEFSVAAHVLDEETPESLATNRSHCKF